MLGFIFHPQPQKVAVRGAVGDWFTSGAALGVILSDARTDAPRLDAELLGLRATMTQIDTVRTLYQLGAPLSSMLPFIAPPHIVHVKQYEWVGEPLNHRFSDAARRVGRFIQENHGATEERLLRLKQGRKGIQALRRADRIALVEKWVVHREVLPVVGYRLLRPPHDLSRLRSPVYEQIITALGNNEPPPDSATGYHWNTLTERGVVEPVRQSVVVIPKTEPPPHPAQSLWVATQEDLHLQLSSMRAGDVGLCPDAQTARDLHAYLSVPSAVWDKNASRAQRQAVWDAVQDNNAAVIGDETTLFLPHSAEKIFVLNPADPGHKIGTDFHIPTYQLIDECVKTTFAPSATDAIPLGARNDSRTVFIDMQDDELPLSRRAQQALAQGAATLTLGAWAVCPACGWHAECNEGHAVVTRGTRTVCPVCRHTQAFPSVCPACGGWLMPTTHTYPPTETPQYDSEEALWRATLHGARHPALVIANADTLLASYWDSGWKAAQMLLLAKSIAEKVLVQTFYPQHRVWQAVQKAWQDKESVKQDVPHAASCVWRWTYLGTDSGAEWRVYRVYEQYQEEYCLWEPQPINLRGKSRWSILALHEKSQPVPALGGGWDFDCVRC